MEFIKKYSRGFTLVGLLVAIVLMTFAWMAVIGPALAPESQAADGSFTTNKHWKQKFEYFSGTAGESISLGDAIAYNRYSGKLNQADADDADAYPCIGFAGNSASADESVQIITKGILGGMPCGLGTEASSAITPIGIPLFLAHAPVGGVTTVGGLAANSGISQYVATAMPLSQQAVDSGVTTGTDTYFVDVAGPQILSGTTPINSGVAKWE